MGAVVDRAQRVAEPVEGRVERGPHPAGLVAGGEPQALVQPPLGDLLQDRHGPAQRPGDATGDPHGHQQRDEQAERQRRTDLDAHARLQGLDLGVDGGAVGFPVGGGIVFGHVCSSVFRC